MRALIIAEAGVNHNGSIELAKRLVDIAVTAGADAVKFQTFNAESLVSRSAPKADYQLSTTDNVESHFDMIKKLELSADNYIELIRYCKERSILFLASPFDAESIALLEDLGLTTFKIPSGEITNLLYLRKVGSAKKNVILSTGMSNLHEIENALNVLIREGTEKRNIVILHCNTEYPTPMEDVNLRAMQTIRETFDVRVGYSDHTLGIEVPVAAVAMGAEVIEKHFTLDRNMEGPDHKSSLEPDELKSMVRAIRNIEAALGNGIKKPTSSELKNISIVRKSIVASRDINKGEAFSEDNLTVKRPATGLSPMKWHDIIGKTAQRDFKTDEVIEL